MLSSLISCTADHVPSRGLLLDLLGRRLRVNFMGRDGYGLRLGLGCRELRVVLSFRCLFGLRGLALGCGRLFRAPGDFSFPGLAGCFVLCLGHLGLRLLVLECLALGCLLSRCCLLRRGPLVCLHLGAGLLGSDDDRLLHLFLLRLAGRLCVF